MSSVYVLPLKNGKHQCKKKMLGYIYNYYYYFFNLLGLKDQGLPFQQSDKVRTPPVVYFIWS